MILSGYIYRMNHLSSNAICQGSAWGPNSGLNDWKCSLQTTLDSPFPRNSLAWLEHLKPPSWSTSTASICWLDVVLEKGASAENERPVRSEPWCAEMRWLQHNLLAQDRSQKWPKDSSLQLPDNQEKLLAKNASAYRSIVGLCLYIDRKNELHVYHQGVGTMHELPNFDVTSTFA